MYVLKCTYHDLDIPVKPCCERVGGFEGSAFKPSRREPAAWNIRVRPSYESASRIMQCTRDWKCWKSSGLSEAHLFGMDTLDAKTTVRLYEALYTAVHREQNELAEPEATTVDPFTFLASASMRAESTCWEWLCRLRKLDFLSRYAVLYANRVTVPLPLRRPDTIKDVAWAKSLLTTLA